MDIPAEAPPRPRKIPRVKPADRNEGKGMLYLDCEVEGKHIKAFVDTGAQVTVMSAACAESCGILKNLDRRFAGRAVGVGSARIMGRIHNAHLRWGAATFLSLHDIAENTNLFLPRSCTGLGTPISLARSRLLITQRWSS
jgi:hypothetical protein